ncbi:MAG: AsmA-like C-terminal region-containing protein [Candidatus Omnitrophota bacterium]
MRLLKFFTVLLVLLALLAVVLYFVMPSWIPSEDLRSQVAHQIETVTTSVLTYGDATVRLFPFTEMQFKDVRIKQESGKAEITADRFTVQLDLIGLFFRRYRMSGMRVEGGSLKTSHLWEGCPWDPEIREMRLQLKPTRKDSVQKLEIEGNLHGLSKNLKGHATIDWSTLAAWSWKNVVLSGEILLSDVDLATLPGNAGDTAGALQVDRGLLKTQIAFEKAAAQDKIKIDLETSITDLVYHAQPASSTVTPQAPIELGLKVRGDWDPMTDEVALAQATFHLPWGEAEAQGLFSLATGEIREMRISAVSVPLEQIPHYCGPLKNSLPVNLGFSGPSHWDITLRGTLDQLSANVNVDLEDATLTYGKYFSKTKGLPMQVAMAFLLKDHRFLTGDLSAYMKDLTLKASVTEGDLQARSGQLNLITNKFPLAAQRELFPSLAEYQAEGNAKVLANWKGDFGQPEALEVMTNITLENASFQRGSGPLVRDIKMAIDVSPMILKVREGVFRLGDSVVDFKFTGYQLFRAPKIEMSVGVTGVRPSVFLGDAAALIQALAPDVLRAENISQAGFLRWFPEEEAWESASSDITYQKEKGWTFSNLHVKAYGGDWKAALDFPPASDLVKQFDLTLQAEQVDLGFWTRKTGAIDPRLAGKAFLDLNLRGETSAEGEATRLSGQGKILVTEGTFYGFDLQDAAGSFGKLQELKVLATGRTPFTDLQGTFKIEGTKFTTEDLMMVGPHLSARATGEFAEDGFLNFRIHAFLSKEDTRNFLREVLHEDADPSLQLGPLPFLLVGSFDRPEIKPDPEKMADFLKDLEEKKIRSILQTF